MTVVELLRELREDGASPVAQDGKPIAELREAVRLKSDDTTVRVQLGRALLADGKVDEAIAELRTARKPRTRECVSS